MSGPKQITLNHSPPEIPAEWLKRIHDRAREELFRFDPAPADLEAVVVGAGAGYRKGWRDAMAEVARQLRELAE